jgi:hypothetical protein
MRVIVCVAVMMRVVMAMMVAVPMIMRVIVFAAVRAEPGMVMRAAAPDDAAPGDPEADHGDERITRDLDV